MNTYDESYPTAILGKTERPVGWEGNGQPAMMELVRHSQRKRGEIDRCHLPLVTHFFTLDETIMTNYVKINFEASKKPVIFDQTGGPPFK